MTSIPTLLAALTGAAFLACSAQTAKADVIFTESFTLDSSNWSIGSSGTLTPATWVNTGGPNGAGDGYITRTVPTSGSQTLFRGQDNFNSSSDGFVGNWSALGVSNFSLDLRQDSGSDKNFTLRFASSANFPGASTVAFTVPSGIWTSVSFPIIDSPSVFQTYEGSDFSTIFNAIGNVQLSISPSLPGSSFHLDIDNPTISTVPEPSTYALAGVALFGVMARRMKRKV